MDEAYCYSFVEDAPSREILARLVEHRNLSCFRQIRFVRGFPNIMRGSGNLKKNIPGIVKMANPKTPVLCLVDLDTTSSACALMADWFGSRTGRAQTLPKGLVFRVAVREIEAWIMADRRAWASHLGIPLANFTETPDALPDPKQFLLNVVRSKGKKKMHAEMLPRGTAHIGPRYNEVLCSFIQKKWSPDRAAENSPSLKRAIQALQQL